MLNRYKIFITIIILISFFLCTVCGCNIVSTIREKANHTIELENTIQNCFNNNDVEGLYNLFSEETRKKPYLLNRLKTLCYLWNSVVKDGSSIEFRHDAGGGKEYRDGEIVYDSQTFDIVSHEGTNIEYTFRVYDFRIYKDSPKKEGVYAISLISGNTLIYGTDYKGEKAPEELIYPPMYCERQEKILDDIFLLIGNEEYIQAGDNERIVFLQEKLETTIKKDYEENGSYVIELSTIEDTTSNDGNGEYPAIQFQFIDGSTFIVIVHNNP